MAAFPYDSALVAATRNPPRSVAEVLTIMQAIDAACVDGDGLKWFNVLYLQVTQAVEQQIAAGGFADSAWLVELDIQFARLYFNALGAALLGAPVPDCWHAILDMRANTRLARIQFALAGVNAHINHDLPVAIVATCKATGTVPNRRSVQCEDYTRVNATLDSLIESAKRTLQVRLLGDPLPAVAYLEDTIAAWSIKAARDKSWTNSQVLWHLQGSPDLALGFADSLDGLTAVVSKGLLVPVP